MYEAERLRSAYRVLKHAFATCNNDVYVFDCVATVRPGQIPLM
jgi:hypothetical protein